MGYPCFVPCEQSTLLQRLDCCMKNTNILLDTHYHHGDFYHDAKLLFYRHGKTVLTTTESLLPTMQAHRRPLWTKTCMVAVHMGDYDYFIVAVNLVSLRGRSIGIAGRL